MLDRGILVTCVFITTFTILHSIGPPQQNPPGPIAWNPPVQFAPQPPPPPPPIHKPAITTQIPGYQNYNEIWGQLQTWNQEAPDFTEIGVYGKSSHSRDLRYIRVVNKYSQQPKPVVLITASIHGNEPLSTSTVMAYIGTLLGTYGEDPEATELINTRDIYFIPVVSPDSYPRSRHVDGVDPNRNFPTARDPSRRSVPPIQELRKFFKQIQPRAAISGHTFGRMFLHPWGDQRTLSPNQQDFQRIVGRMGELANYRVIRACQIYNRPIFGTEVDWYYRQGAFSLVIEYGTHQRIPSMQDTKVEFDRTYRAVLHFIKEAPIVEIATNYRLAA